MMVKERELNNLYISQWVIGLSLVQVAVSCTENQACPKLVEG